MKGRVLQLLRTIRYRPPPSPPSQTEPWPRISKTDMHRCLRLPETLGLIFDFVEDRNTLVSLTCVCTQFVEMAAERILRHLSNIYELLMTLPRNLWELKVLHDKNTKKSYNYLLPWVISIAREVTSEEWKILLAKAAKVKTIGVHTNRLDYLRRTTSSDPDNQDPRVFRGRILVPDTTAVEVLSKCPATLLFPGLRSLRGQIPVALVPRVLSPSLYHLHISALETEEIWYNRIPVMENPCPELRSFVWKDGSRVFGGVVDRHRLEPHFILQWHHLQSYTGPADEQILHHFSRLPQLDSLSLWLLWEHSAQSLRPTSATTKIRLQSLCSLRCFTNSLEHVVKAIEILFGTEDSPTFRCTRPTLQHFCAQGLHLRESVSATPQISSPCGHRVCL
ncbi:hypothetical protein CONPUDRAFT_147342 [Coniophora puteana RWD-64-598 SS2]|uniref:F-box domain-containing protein n=1 Tax=Coniophora puteana (strain RWD-64-598) TaxID=741705 RepID=A0A5M3M849_CONPW|nr:uncharacterized protein CONPUDRAFT_147342 [Coniophora puteana RWD-64-598 SS2]EIW75223.1 hypothetical protein CONPUDRAFT_147342 [Coniophora puteana RWD-64-598 SS2]